MSELTFMSANLKASNASQAPANQTGEADLKNTSAGRKLLKATQEFEANLLSAWWEEAEKDFQDASGGELGSGFEGLKGAAMNSMAAGIVKAGGVGISRTLFHSLEPALRRKLQEQAGPETEGHSPSDQPSANKTGG